MTNPWNLTPAQCATLSAALAALSPPKMAARDLVDTSEAKRLARAAYDRWKRAQV